MIEKILPAGVTNVKGVEGVKETAPKENVKEADNNTNFLKKTEGLSTSEMARAIREANVANAKDVSEVESNDRKQKTPEEIADEVLFKDFIRHRKSPELKDIENDLKNAKKPVFDPRNFAGGEYHKSIDVKPKELGPEYTVTTQIDIVYAKDEAGKDIAKITITHEWKKNGIGYRTEGGHESICELRKM